MSTRLRRRVDRRVTSTVAAGVSTAFIMVLFGMEPRLVIVGFIAMAAGAAIWLALDLGPVAAPLAWRTHDADDRGRAPRADRRVQALQRRLRSPRRARRSAAPADVDRSEPADEVADALVRIIDEQVANEFGIDRALQPSAAADIMGPELTAFVTDPDVRRSMSTRRRLRRTIELVEHLCQRTRTPTRTTS